MTENFWTLHRVGWEEPNFTLQPHLDTVTLGRSVDVQKQLLANHISRIHCQFTRTVDATDHNRIYWEILDPGSSTRTFLNRVCLPAQSPMRLNDRDLIGVGSNPTRSAAKNMKRVFLFEIRAPTKWSQAAAAAVAKVKQEAEETIALLGDDEEEAVAAATSEEDTAQQLPPTGSEASSSKERVPPAEPEVRSRKRKAKSDSLLDAIDSNSSSDDEPLAKKKKKNKKSRKESFSGLVSGQSVEVRLRRLNTSRNCETAKVGPSGLLTWLSPSESASGVKDKNHEVIDDMFDAVSDDELSPSLLSDHNNTEEKDPSEMTNKPDRSTSTVHGRTPQSSSKVPEASAESDSDLEDFFESSYSQNVELITIDSDTEYFQSSQVHNIKQEEMSEESSDEESKFSSHDEEEHAVTSGQKRSKDSDISVIDLCDDDLDASQMSLFQKIVDNIKREAPESDDDNEDDVAQYLAPSCSSSSSSPSSSSPSSDEDEEVEREPKKKQLLQSEETAPRRGISKKDTSASEPLSAVKQLLQRSKSEDGGATKQIQVIEALPQPLRRAKNRGLSGVTAQRLMEEKVEIDSANCRTTSERIPSPEKHAGRSHDNKQSAHGQGSSAKYLSKDDIAKKRKEKLKELADNQRKSNAKTAERVKPPPINIKQSLPKAQKLIDCDFLKPLPPLKKPVFLTRHPRPAVQDVLSVGQDSESPSTSSAAAASLGPPPPPRRHSASSDASDCAKKSVRTKAETQVDYDGQKRIGKLKFDNVLSNVFSQDLLAGSSDRPPPPPPHFHVAASAAQAASCLSRSKKRAKGKLSWKLTSSGDVYVDVRYIPQEGKGQRTNTWKNFDANVRNRTPLPLPNAAKGGVVAPAASIVDKKKKDVPRYNDIVKRILHWRTIWLSEHATILASAAAAGASCPPAPPVQGPGMKLNHVPPVYHDYKDYCSTFYPLLLHEIWASAYKDYTDNCQAKCPDVLMAVTSIKKDDSYTNFCLTGFVSNVEAKNESYLPVDGYLCRVDLRCCVKPTAQKDDIRRVFGYVVYSRIRRLNNSDKTAAYFKPLMDASIESRRKQLTHVIEVRLATELLSPEVALTLSKPLVVKGISRIKPILRLVQAVEDVTHSKLFDCVLKADPKYFHLGTGIDDIRPDIKDLAAVRNLNDAQKSIVTRTARQCTVNPDRPFVSLIQGPPGTGKTSTIVGLILQIYSRWRFTNPGQVLPRILLVAPSNAAVDEVVVRLIKLHGLVKVMRVGRVGKIHSEAKHVLFETLLEHEIARLAAENTNQSSVRLETQQRQAAINLLGTQLEEHSHDAAKVALIHRKMKEENVLLSRAKASLQSLCDQEKHKFRNESTERLFEHADIIATTLSSSMNGQMSRYFLDVAAREAARGKRHRPFSICIMDEATQCVEPEALVPFKLGFNKLIMVGDPEQLGATVTSPEAKKLSYNVSLFKRLYDRLRATSPVSPVQKLLVQYRMHPEIARWPNRFFYGDELQNGPQSRNSFLLPFLLFDLKSAEEQQRGASIQNPTEAKYVGKLVRKIQLAKKNNGGENLTVAVLTFYAKQKDCIENELQRIGCGPGSANGCVAVRTVDGFQGSECDVVIISCVRTKGKIGFVAELERLNVALTRARYALYLVGHFDVFMGNPMWRDLVMDSKARKTFRIAAPDSEVGILRQSVI